MVSLGHIHIHHPHSCFFAPCNAWSLVALFFGNAVIEYLPYISILYRTALRAENFCGHGKPRIIERQRGQQLPALVFRQVGIALVSTRIPVQFN